MGKRSQERNTGQTEEQRQVEATERMRIRYRIGLQQAIARELEANTFMQLAEKELTPSLTDAEIAQVIETKGDKPLTIRVRELQAAKKAAAEVKPVDAPAKPPETAPTPSPEEESRPPAGASSSASGT